MSIFSWNPKDSRASEEAARQQLEALKQQYYYAQQQAMAQQGLQNSLRPDRPVERATRGTEILAWRAWRLHPQHDDLLLSVTRDVRWDGPALRADKEPGIDHLHGVYALRGLKGIDPGYRDGNPVHGVVALSGTVIEGTSGYRAEQAVIRALWIVLGPFRVVRPELAPVTVMGALEERYQCPVSFTQGEGAEQEIAALLAA